MYRLQLAFCSGAIIYTKPLFVTDRVNASASLDSFAASRKLRRTNRVANRTQNGAILILKHVRNEYVE